VSEGEELHPGWVLEHPGRATFGVRAATSEDKIGHGSTYRPTKGITSVVTQGLCDTFEEFLGFFHDYEVVRPSMLPPTAERGTASLHYRLGYVC
jgi:hypothetical protein